jgi:hypothetical protein
MTLMSASIFSVMPRLGLGIHEFGVAGEKLVDPKAKPWDDDRVGGWRW